MSNSIQRTAPLSKPPAKGLAPEREKPKPPALPPTNPPKEPEGGNGGKGRAGKSTSVYFSNGAHLEYLTKLGETFPKASVSSVMSQLLAAFVKASQAGKGGDNRVELTDAKIYI